MAKCANSQLVLKWIVLASLLLHITIFSPGCTVAIDKSAQALHILSPTTSERSESGLAFDAGLFFVNQASYVCIPFQRLGISNDQKVASVTSGCECVKPSVVRYRVNGHETKPAIRLDLVDESKQNNSNLVSLGVSVKICFLDGDEQVFVFSFQHAEALK